MGLFHHDLTTPCTLALSSPTPTTMHSRSLQLVTNDNCRSLRMINQTSTIAPLNISPTLLFPTSLGDKNEILRPMVSLDRRKWMPPAVFSLFPHTLLYFLPRPQHNTTVGGLTPLPPPLFEGALITGSTLPEVLSVLSDSLFLQLLLALRTIPIREAHSLLRVLSLLSHFWCRKIVPFFPLG